jgi:hypothetical protein
VVSVAGRIGKMKEKLNNNNSNKRIKNGWREKLTGGPFQSSPPATSKIYKITLRVRYA